MIVKCVDYWKHGYIHYAVSYKNEPNLFLLPISPQCCAYWLCTIFHSGGIHYILANSVKLSPFLHTIHCPYMLSMIILIITILTGMRWHFIQILICFCPMIRDDDPPPYLLDTPMSCFEKCLFRSSAHFSMSFPSIYLYGYLCSLSVWMNSLLDA